MALSRIAQRPQTLQEVVELGDRHGDVSGFMREFLDEFYTADDNRRADMIAVIPPLTYNAQTNAYLAAAAEHLALCYNLPIPAWANEPPRFLKKPYFPAGLESLKATYIAQSPAAFRRRMIFVESDPLSRPRRSEAPKG